MLEADRVRTLDELNSVVDSSPFLLSRDKRWELCSSCPLVPCDPKSQGCRCRRFVNERQRGYRKGMKRKPLTDDQRQRHNETNRAYYRECADVVKQKERDRYYLNRDTILARKLKQQRTKREALKASSGAAA